MGQGSSSEKNGKVGGRRELAKSYYNPNVIVNVTLSAEPEEEKDIEAAVEQSQNVHAQSAEQEEKKDVEAVEQSQKDQMLKIAAELVKCVNSEPKDEAYRDNYTPPYVEKAKLLLEELRQKKLPIENQGMVVFIDALQRGNKAMLELLWQEKELLKINVHYAFDSGVTLLHEAVKHHNITAVRLLLQAGVDVNAVDENKNSALHKAFDYFGMFHDYKTIEVCKEIVECLLQAHADLALENKKSLTPPQLLRDRREAYEDLFYLLGLGYQGGVRQHIDFGISLVFKKFFQDARLDTGYWNPEQQVEAFKQFKEHMESLEIWKKLPWESKLYYRNASLIFFSSIGHIPLIEYGLTEPSCFKNTRAFRAYPLSQKNAETGILSKQLHGATMLTAAIAGEMPEELRVKTIHFLIQSGFSVDQLDCRGESPLNLAIKLRRVEEVAALLGYKPDLFIAHEEKNVFRALNSSSLCYQESREKIKDQFSARMAEYQEEENKKKISTMITNHLKQELAEPNIVSSYKERVACLLYGYGKASQEECAQLLKPNAHARVLVDEHEEKYNLIELKEQTVLELPQLIRESIKTESSEISSIEPKVNLGHRSPKKMLAFSDLGASSVSGLVTNPVSGLGVSSGSVPTEVLRPHFDGVSSGPVKP